MLYDRAPLQVTQFEADIRIARQLEKLWLEKGGGGNSCESYNLPWYFAALHTSIDCFEKRGKKGYLFTVGDEEPPLDLPAAAIARFLGDRPQRDFSSRELLTMVSRMYHVFHVIVEEGSHARHDPHGVRSRWVDLLGQRVIGLSDHTRLAEVIVSAIEVNEGRDRDKVVKSWSKQTALVVQRARGGAAPAPGRNAGVVRFSKDRENDHASAKPTAQVVIGAQFGDEGKGRVTDYYAAEVGGDGIVIRFNGGAQAGHTVVAPDGRRHVFSHIGSGALRRRRHLPVAVFRLQSDAVSEGNGNSGGPGRRTDGLRRSRQAR